MNLVNDPWIPVVMPDGVARLVSLHELFSEADRIRDLACNPPQRIALMRLLICITQAALDGPEDEKDWYGCKGCISTKSLAYLKKWEYAFDLRGDKPFMQIADLEVAPGKTKPLDLLDFRLARENNPTLFDHGATKEGRAFSDPDIALNLITLLNFSTQGRIGQAIWNGQQCSQQTFIGPCLNCAFTFLRGADMLATVHLNLMTRKGENTGVCHLPNGRWGIPVWEKFPQHSDDKEAFKNATETYVGRLVPLSRSIRILGANGTTRCILGPLPSGYRVDRLPLFREPWTTVVMRGDTPRELGVDPSRHMWRELGSLLSLSKSRTGATASLSLYNLRTYFELFPGQVMDVWVGGLKSGGGGGKLVDMAEWSFIIQSDDFGARTLAQIEKGVDLADKGVMTLEKAIKTFHTWLNSSHVPYDVARRRYWADLDRRYGYLLETARASDGRLADTWYPLVRQAMRDAYAYVCPCGTAREIEAYAQGQDKLRLKKPEN